MESSATLAQRIDALLPQTQCTRCSYPACRDYANAIAAEVADINQCPPGGARGIELLAQLLGRQAKPLNPNNGIEKPREIAVIDEEICIGCTKCIQACPVDAIVGAAKVMHTIIVAECSGCELCIAPCPVDCIDMVPANDRRAALQLAPQYRERYETHSARIARAAAEATEEVAQRKATVESANAVGDAVARARARKAARGNAM
ncbi:MAG TPA: RnfABCDGE type electron transport complex subunit B [Rudaea sp.]|jgi:electron transport complex protein RnfB|nr:RnfABCDGE type electron transport complex subunit B [Rudaea sp.]